MNLVSDEDEPVQPEKPCEDKNTTSNSKSQEYNGVIKPPSSSIPKTQPKSLQKDTKDHSTRSQNRLPAKAHRSKEIKKPKLLQKKHKIRREGSAHVPKKTAIHSQRISEKETSKKPPFRLSKHKREQL